MKPNKRPRPDVDDDPVPPDDDSPPAPPDPRQRKKALDELKKPTPPHEHDSTFGEEDLGGKGGQ